MLIEDFDELSKLNEAIDNLLSELVTMPVTDDSYSKLVDQLTKLTKIKQNIVETKLKDFAAEEEAHQFRQTFPLKEREQDLKEREYTLKATTHDNDLEFKTRELNQRQVEHDETFALRKREIDIKEISDAKPDRVSKDALVAAGASIAGILVIVGYERMNVIASKALSFVLKR